MRRPWNIVNSPVYSLATLQDEQVNMNICSYVTAISRKPKMYAIAIEHGSQTHTNLQVNGTCVLQFLSSAHHGLIRPLGHRSGVDFSKDSFLRRSDRLTLWKGVPVLRDCAAYVQLELFDYLKTGDHDLMTFHVTASSTLSEDDLLMFQDLIDQGIILS